MYSAFLNGTCILDPRSEILIEDPKLELADNSAGSFSFTIHSNNPGYKLIKLMTGIVTVKWEDEILFKGRIITAEKNFDKSVHVECEGELAYLADSIQRPHEYHNIRVRDYLVQLVTLHNAQVEEGKRFKVGAVTVKDPNDSLYRYTNWENTLETLKSDLLEDLGGHFRVRYQGDERYLDYLADWPRLSAQKIEFGENLLSYSETYSAMDIATVCIPLGAKKETSSIEALEERVTIGSLKNGVDSLELYEAIKTYGRIVKTVIFDNVTSPAMLIKKGKKWLEDNQYENLELNLTAVDLADFGIEADHLRLLDRIHCISKPHGMDREFPLTAMSINLLDATQNVYTLGSKQKTFSETAKVSEYTVLEQMKNAPVKSHVLQQALANATQLLTMTGKDGHVIFHPSISEPRELFITDYPNIEQARNVWRWNVNGLGYSSNGINGPYKLAITMDGTIAGDFIAARSIAADKISISYTTEQERKWKDKLQNEYSTRVEVESAIQNTKNAVITYVDARGNNYASRSEVKLTTDGITSEVRRKVGTNEIISRINQSPEGLQIDARRLNINSDAIRLQAKKLTWTSELSNLNEAGQLDATEVKVRYGMEIYGRNMNAEPYIDFHPTTNLNDTSDYDARLSVEHGVFKLKSKGGATNKPLECGQITANGDIRVKGVLKVLDGSSWRSGYTGTKNGIRFVNGVAVG